MLVYYDVVDCLLDIVRGWYICEFNIFEEYKIYGFIFIVIEFRCSKCWY